jgi:hypothetical protein
MRLSQPDNASPLVVSTCIKRRRFLRAKGIITRSKRIFSFPEIFSQIGLVSKQFAGKDLRSINRGSMIKANEIKRNLSINEES